MEEKEKKRKRKMKEEEGENEKEEEEDQEGGEREEGREEEIKVCLSLCCRPSHAILGQASVSSSHSRVPASGSPSGGDARGK